MKLFAFVLLSSTVALAGTQPPTGSTAKLDRRVAMVDRVPIWMSEIEETFEHAGVATPTKDQLELALDSLIDLAIVEHAADAAHITASDAEVDMAIDEIKKQNKIDDAGLEKALADQHYTRAIYRVELARQLRAQKMFQVELVPRIAVTDDEVKKAYDKLKATTPGIDTLDKIKDAVRQSVWSEKLAAEQESWLRRKRAEAHVERKL